MPSVIHFSDPAPEPVEDRPALSRAIGAPPLRLTAVQRVGPGFAELRYEVPRSGTPAA